MSRLIRSTRSKIFLAGGTIAGLIVVVAAVAFFTGGNGSGTGSATVGSSTAWSVATGSTSFIDSGGATGCDALYPGACKEAVSFTVTNGGKGHQQLKTVSYAIAQDTSGTNCPGTSCTNANYGDAESYNGTSYADIVGCLAGWFGAVGETNPTLPADIGPGSTYTGKVDVTMSNDTTTNQDACQGKSPAVVVTASSS